MPLSGLRRRHVLLLTAAPLFLLMVTAPPAARAASLAAPRIVYTSPVDRAQRTLPQSGIIVRFDRPIAAAAGGEPVIVASGSASGAHPGRTIVADDGRTLLFTPGVPFARGEHVAVSVAPTAGSDGAARSAPATFAFDIAGSAPPPLSAAAQARLMDLPDVQPDIHTPDSAPALSARRNADLPPDFPVITTQLNSPPAPGRLFIGSFSFVPGPPNYLLILDDYSQPIFYRHMNAGCLDFKVQPDGTLTYYDLGAGEFFALDSTYTFKRNYVIGNGYATDTHELRVLPNGHALMLSYDPEIVDMSGVVPGGNPEATVIGLILQEVDASGNVVFQWRSWDHFQITDATLEDLTAPVIDYVHGNAIELDADGNLVLSSRHMDEITKIDRNTGAILWRWGGKHNQFAFLGDTLRFSHQHAIRRIANGDFTMFDNGNGRPLQYSRAVEFRLDQVAHTATNVWQYRHVPDIYGSSMGYVQRLDDGHTLVCWGGANPNVTEVDTQGNVVLDLTLPTGLYTYRAFRTEWFPPSQPEWLNVPPIAYLRPLQPNPIHGSTALALWLQRPATVTAKLYDIHGRVVRDLMDGVAHDAGSIRLPVDLAGAPSGVYFARVTAGTQSATQKLVLTH